MRFAAIALAAVAACGGDSDDDGDRCLGCPPGTLVSAAVARSDNEARVTAVAPSAGEPPWFAGSYEQNLTIDGRVIGPSAQTGALFVARVAPRELDGPYVGVGPSPVLVTVAGIAPDAEQGAIAIVHDIQPADERFVEAVWLDRTEMVAQRVTLATLAAAGPSGTVAVMATDPLGWPIVAVSGTDVDVDEDPPVLGERAVVMRIGQGLRRDILFSQAGLEITAIAAPTAETIVIGGRYSVPPDGWQDCPETSCGFIAAIDGGTGAGVRWVREFRAEAGAVVRAVAGHPAGNAAALVEIAGNSIDPPPFATPIGLYIAYVDAAGADQTLLPLATGFTGISGAIAVDVNLTTVLALAVGSTPVDLAGTPFTGEGGRDVVVAELHPNNGLLWMLPVRAGTDAGVGALAVAGRQIAVGGSFEGTLSVPSGPISEVDATTTQGYILELAH